MNLPVAARSALVLASVFALASPAPAAAEPGRSYEIVLLESLPGASGIEATGINRHGDIVGLATFAGELRTTRRAVVWRDGSLFDTGFEALGLFQRGAHINSAGEVAGADGPDRESHAHLWRRGRAIDLGTLPGDDYSYALAINDRGQVLALSGRLPNTVEAMRARRGFLWQDGVATRLDFHPSSALNDRGQVIGTEDLYDAEGNLLAQRGILWHDGSQTILDDVGGGVQTLPIALNARGEIAGLAVTAAGETHAFFWRDGKTTDLGPEIGATYSLAAALNDRGDVVGTFTAADGSTHGYLWNERESHDLGRFFPAAVSERGQVVGVHLEGVRAAVWEDGNLVDLGTLPGGGYSEARAITSRGEIVGNSTDAAGVKRAVLWTPRSPRPSADANAGAGGLAVHGAAPGSGLRVHLSLPDDRPARLRLCDVRGRSLFVRELGALAAGDHMQDLEVPGLARGVYYVSLEQGGRRATSRLVVLD